MADDRATRAGWQWRLMVAILVGMAAGFGAAWLLGFSAAGVQAAIVCALTLAAGSHGRLRTALPVAAVLGGVVVAYSSLGAVTTGYPVAAALAMAFVAFSTSVMTAAVPVGLLVGMVASNAYFLVTAVGVIESKAIGGDLGEIGLLGLIGLGTGLLLVVARSLVEQAIGTVPSTRETQAPPSLLGPMRASLRTFDDHAKDGVRRALALGIAMLAFQYYASHNAFWVMLTVFVILGPKGRPTLALAARRVVGTLFGVVAVVALAMVLSTTAAVVLGLISLALSLAASSRSTTVSAAFGAAAAAVLTAIPSGDFTGYAGARLLDTLVGSALALGSGYLLWPRSGGSTQVPDDLTADASRAGVAG